MAALLAPQATLATVARAARALAATTISGAPGEKGQAAGPGLAEEEGVPALALLRGLLGVLEAPASPGGRQLAEARPPAGSDCLIGRNGAAAPRDLPVLWVCPGDGGIGADGFRPLAAELPDGLEVRAFDGLLDVGSPGYDSLEECAARCLRQARNRVEVDRGSTPGTGEQLAELEDERRTRMRAAEGSWVLMGHSWGCLLALEVARQLEEDEGPGAVPTLILLDPSPELFASDHRGPSETPSHRERACGLLGSEWVTPHIRRWGQELVKERGGEELYAVADLVEALGRGMGPQEPTELRVALAELGRQAAVGEAGQEQSSAEGMAGLREACVQLANGGAKSDGPEGSTPLAPRSAMAEAEGEALLRQLRRVASRRDRNLRLAAGYQRLGLRRSGAVGSPGEVVGVQTGTGLLVEEEPGKRWGRRLQTTVLLFLALEQTRGDRWREIEKRSALLSALSHTAERLVPIWSSGDHFSMLRPPHARGIGVVIAESLRSAGVIQG